MLPLAALRCPWTLAPVSSCRRQGERLDRAVTLPGAPGTLVKPSPCDQCRFGPRCVAERLACDAYRMFAVGLAATRWQSAPRAPTRAILELTVIALEKRPLQACRALSVREPAPEALAADSGMRSSSCPTDTEPLRTVTPLAECSRSQCGYPAPYSRTEDLGAGT